MNFDLKMPVINSVKETFGQRKTAVGVFGTTGATGLSQWMNWIPNDIGKLASLVAMICSIVYVIIQIVKAIDDHKMRTLEIREADLLLEELEKKHAEDGIIPPEDSTAHLKN
jgi:hypothetical protein